MLAATSLGTFFYLGSKIDALARGSTTASTLARRMDAGFARLDARLNNLETRLDAHLDRHAS